MPYLFQYADVDRLVALLHLDPTDTLARVLLQDLNEAAGQRINEATGRTFLPVTETRTFDAPAAPDLPVDDLLAVTAVTLNGVPLTAGTQYTLRPAHLTVWQPTYTHLVRLLAGLPARWGVRPARSAIQSIPISRWAVPLTWQSLAAAEYPIEFNQSPLGAVSITGTWGWGLTVPPPIAFLAERLVARAYHARVREYSDPGAAPDGSAAAAPTPEWDKDAEAVAALYRKKGAA